MSLTDHLKSLIKIKGSLTVAEFMQEVLFNPAYGYYQKKNPIGKEGDFTTAPEISQVFGELIGLYFLNLANNTKDPIALVEMGAGKGSLFRDLLVIVKKLAEKNIVEAENFLKKTSFHIVEISPNLQKSQQETLSKTGLEINWHRDFEGFLKNGVKKDEEIYFIANELFDCFAINQFIKTNQGWCEKVISLKEDELEFFVEDFNPLKSKIVEDLVLKQNVTDVKEGAIFENSSAALGFMQELSRAINSHGGIGLIIDYGYIKNELQNSLQALKNHQYHNCLKDIGQADITALVNFSDLENAAKKQNLNTSLVTQKEFLESLGIEQRRQILLQGKSAEQKKDINSRIDRLIDVKQMGELFKCLIFWK